MSLGQEIRENLPSGLHKGKKKHLSGACSLALDICSAITSELLNFVGPFCPVPVMIRSYLDLKDTEHT